MFYQFDLRCLFKRAFLTGFQEARSRAFDNLVKIIVGKLTSGVVFESDGGNCFSHSAARLRGRSRRGGNSRDECGASAY